MNPFDENYWTKRYHSQETGWDLGSVSPPLKAYFDQLLDKNIRILIPGAGNAYEAEYLFKQGFTNITVIDLSDAPLKNIQQRIPEFPKENLKQGDFFDLQEKYDMIVEQTFFCALDPSLRKMYVQKMVELLKPNGKLIGLLFNDPLNNEGPPFGGNKEEYNTLFSPLFHLKTFDTCYNSIQPRANRELFILFEKR